MENFIVKEDGKDIFLLIQNVVVFVKHLLEIITQQKMLMNIQEKNPFLRF